MAKAFNHPVNSSTRYVQQVCVCSEDIATSTGIGSEELAKLRRAGCVPQPTYRVYANGAVASAIRTLGEPAGTAIEFYSPAVVWWLRRASTFSQSFSETELSNALKSWLRIDLSRALQLASSDASTYEKPFVWHHLFDHRQLNADRFDNEVNNIWDDWMSGAWAVCLRRFDGHHLVTKEIERARIASITENGERRLNDAQSKIQLLDAIVRLDSVMLPFAPHERPHGTPGHFIDAMLERYDLPRSTSGYSIDWLLAC
jgi:Family of unknown function (DUF6058)